MSILFNDFHHGLLVLEALLATSREMMAFDDLPVLLERVLDRLSAIVKPDRAAILLVDPETGAIVPRAVRPAGAYSSVSEFASSTVVHQALEARDAFIVHDVRMDPRLQEAASVLLAGVRSVICVPLLGRSGAIGALYADKLGLEQFAPDLAEYASAFAGHAAAALETAQLYDDRERHFRATLQAFAKAIDARDSYTAGHSERVTAYTLVLARQSGQHATEFETIRRAGLLHDIGKVGVPDAVLLKAGKLDAAERALIEAHVTIGHDMLVSLPFLGASLPAVRGHHERWDGAGYPDRLAGTDIHPHARLMAVADSYDAMTSAVPIGRRCQQGKPPDASGPTVACSSILRRSRCSRLSSRSSWPSIRVSTRQKRAPNYCVPSTDGIGASVALSICHVSPFLRSVNRSLCSAVVWRAPESGVQVWALRRSA